MGKVITVAQQKGGAGKTTLAVTLAGAFVARGLSVALLDSDPQGTLGRWFMARVEARGVADMEFSTASAWGVSYEIRKLRERFDIVILDTPPKADADLRPALREADLVLVPVTGSHVDLWATDGVLDLVARESGRAMIVLNRMSGGTRLAEEVARRRALWPGWPKPALVLASPMRRHWGRGQRCWTPAGPPPPRPVPWRVRCWWPCDSP